MKTHPLLLALAALLLAGAPAVAQGLGAPPAQPGPEALDDRERPFEMLLQVRDELELDDQQVGRLQQIAAGLESTNRPIREEIARRLMAYREQRRQELLRMTPEQRQGELQRIREQGPPPLPDGIQSLVQQMRMNRAAAMRQAGSVLTPRQKARVREMMQARRAGRMGAGGRRGALGGGRGARFPRGRRP